ncbi:hypothetical protein [Leptospira sarikeiensis]|uniref:hypothetical protein n=1 Tax=Leptospira sarikeiensis TaxID=2484943 RepID=UPI001FE58B77|nr:hypothetical protein [Leptospira sarikeiensis]
MSSIKIKSYIIKTILSILVLSEVSCSEDPKNLGELVAAAKSVLDGTNAPVPIPPGNPAPPGQPVNAPDLQESTITSFDISDEDELSFLGLFSIQSIDFVLPVHDNTTVSAFIGGRNMALTPENTVINSFSHWTVTAGQLAQPGANPPALVGPSDRKLKILIVARNEFGISSKVKQLGQGHFCTGAAALPATVGTCAPACAKASLNGDTVEFKSEFAVSVDTFDYLYTDIAASQPISFSIPAAPLGYFDIFDPVPPGTYSATTSLNRNNFDYMCVEIVSYSYADGPFQDYFLRGRVTIP